MAVPSSTTASTPSLWWESLSEDYECPITLEPINLLPYPPFTLRKQGFTTESDVVYYFDGKALASYIVSRGIFQNPLTRDPLTWDDCRGLDQYLSQYCHDKLNGKRFEVLEAFALRESVQVRTPHHHGNIANSNSNHLQAEARRQRADFLRSEATAALSGLFVYRDARRRNTGRSSRSHEQSHQASTTNNSQSHQEQARPPPIFGFNLHHRQQQLSSNNQNEDDEGYGLIVIDDDDQVREEADQHAYQDLQNAFPRLPTQEESADTVDFNDLAQVNQEQLDHIKRQAERDRQMELVRQRAMEIAKIHLEQEAQQRKVDRERQRQAEKIKASQSYQKQQEQEEELAKARAEIEKWREAHWEQLQKVNERRQQLEREQRERAAQQRALLEQKQEEKKEQEDRERLEQDARDEAVEAEARQKAAKAAKRKRQKERKKQQKAQERQELEKMTKEAELQAKKAASVQKCAACQGGIVGCGFEKFDHQFCSTKCARAGPAQL